MAHLKSLYLPLPWQLRLQKAPDSRNRVASNGQLIALYVLAQVHLRRFSREIHVLVYFLLDLNEINQLRGVKVYNIFEAALANLFLGGSFTQVRKHAVYLQDHLEYVLPHLKVFFMHRRCLILALLLSPHGLFVVSEVELGPNKFDHGDTSHHARL